MKNKADLHTHTFYSDGSLSPEELIIKAESRNIEIIGITDHDTVEGIPEAQFFGKKFGLEVVPGVELSAEIDGAEIHILGYFIDINNSTLTEQLYLFRKKRKERAIQIVGKLNALGLDITIEQVISNANTATIGRPHIADTLYKSGQVKNTFEAFAKYIGNDAPANVGKYYFTVRQAVELINSAGGLAFLAHPAKMKSSILQKVINSGIDGIEYAHPSHSKYYRKKYIDLIRRYNLLGSGGSDFHGGLRNDDKNLGSFTIPGYKVIQIRNKIFRISA